MLQWLECRTLNREDCSSPSAAVSKFGLSRSPNIAYDKLGHLFIQRYFVLHCVDKRISQSKKLSSYSADLTEQGRRPCPQATSGSGVHCESIRNDGGGGHHP